MTFYSLGQLSNSEKSDILSKHRSVYNGYRTMNPEIPNEQPLYTQDFATDKGGITVNNRGEVSSYNNKIYMKESRNEMDEIELKDLEKGKKYKFKSPSFEDDIEFEDEIDYTDKGSKHYSFKGEKMGHLMGDKSVKAFVSKKEDTDEGIYDEMDLKKGEEFDYVKGPANVEEDHMDFYEPMESAFSDELDEMEGPLYSKVEPAYEFKSDGPMQAKGPYHQNEMKEDSDDDDFGFESSFCVNCKGRGCEECNGSGMRRNSIMDTGERETGVMRLRRGKGDIEDIDWEEVDEDIMESFLQQKNKINEMFNRIKKF